MEFFFSFLKIGCIGFLALVALFLVLLALPKSRLRSLVLEMGGWTTTAASAVYVVNPIDIPFIFDDMAAMVVGLLSAAFAYYTRRERFMLDAKEAKHMSDGSRIA